MIRAEAVKSVAKQLAVAEKATETLLTKIIKARPVCDVHYNATAPAILAVAQAMESLASAHVLLKAIQTGCALPGPTPIPQGGGGGGK